MDTRGRRGNSLFLPDPNIVLGAAGASCQTIGKRSLKNFHGIGKRLFLDIFDGNGLPFAVRPATCTGEEAQRRHKGVNHRIPSHECETGNSYLYCLEYKIPNPHTRQPRFIRPRVTSMHLLEHDNTTTRLDGTSSIF